MYRKLVNISTENEGKFNSQALKAITSGDLKIEVIFKINVIDEQTEEIVPMRSETTRKNIMRKYKPSRKGFNSAETGQD